MAAIHREACFYFEGVRDENNTSWQGRGWAKIPLDWLWSGKHEFGWVVTLGKIRLRVIKTQSWEAYVIKDNWRWPIWWALLRLWLALCWFERNLRLTANIWGLLRCDIGAMPRWRDFLLLWYLREWKRPKVFTREMLDGLADKRWPPQ